jgi:hypothetical protein
MKTATDKKATALEQMLEHSMYRADEYLQPYFRTLSGKSELDIVSDAYTAAQGAATLFAGFGVAKYSNLDAYVDDTVEVFRRMLEEQIRQYQE